MALRWYMEAADLGDVAMFNVAECYYYLSQKTGC